MDMISKVGILATKGECYEVILWGREVSWVFFVFILAMCVSNSTKRTIDRKNNIEIERERERERENNIDR